MGSRTRANAPAQGGGRAFAAGYAQVDGRTYANTRAQVGGRSTVDGSACADGRAQASRPRPRGLRRISSLLAASLLVALSVSVPGSATTAVAAETSGGGTGSSASRSGSNTASAGGAENSATRAAAGSTDNSGAGSGATENSGTQNGSAENSGEGPSATSSTSTDTPSAGTTVCTPSVDSATLEVESVDTSARTIHLIGKGWCNEKDGASVVAFKLDNGKISRVEGILNDNATIWAVLDSDIDPHTGDFDVTMQMPDGSTTGANGSTPAFEEGAHTLRALTGSIKDGDPVRSVTTSFTMGAYKPPATSPTPLASSDFTPENRHSLVAGLSGTGEDQQVEVAFPLATEGDWVYMTYYSPDGSQRLVWNEPYQIGEDKIVRLPARNILESGTLSIVAQSGNLATLNTLVGWAPLNFTTSGTTPGSGDNSSSGGSSTDGSQPDSTSSAGENAESTTEKGGSTSDNASGGQQTIIIVEQPAVTAAANQTTTGTTAQIEPKPDTEPDAPVEKNWQLGPQNAGDLTTSVDGEKLIITVPNAALGAWFYLWVYSPTPVRGGWVQTDANGTIAVDVTAMRTGEFKFALLSKDGSLRGWVPLTLSSGDVATPVSADAAAVPVTPAAEVAPLVDWRDWALIGGAILVVLAAAGGVMAGRRSAN